MRRLFTSESVTEGHPDKICDQISDAILDEILKQDPMARVACETSITTGLVLVMGEVTTTGYVDVQSVVRDTIDKIGYNRAKMGFDAETCGIITALHEQSPDIAMGVDNSYETKNSDTADIGAGDQGMMFGFACDETDVLMPMPIYLAHRLSKRLTDVRKNGTLSYLRPDGKTQVTVEYEDDKPVRIDTVVISTQHSDTVSMDDLKSDIKKYVIDEIIPSDLIDDNTKIYINPTGRFVVGGPKGDSGLTGRKIIVDTYGGYASHGGGAFSGKDPTKVDRSACYAARYVAKNIVKAGLCKKCEIQLAYAIGVAKPVSVMINTYGTNVIPEEEISKLVDKHFDLRPSAIISGFDLRRPIYKDTAAYGHFGREDIVFPWEVTDKAEILRKEAGI